MAVGQSGMSALRVSSGMGRSSVAPGTSKPVAYSSRGSDTSTW